MERLRPAFRDVAIGVCALIVHFAVDAAESWSHVRSSMRRVRADAATEEALTGEVMRFVAGVFGGYLLIGLGVGVLLHAWVRLVGPKRPVRFALASVVVGGLLANLRQMIVQPGLHDWFLFRAQLSDHVPPVAITALVAALGLAGVIVGVRRAGPRALGWLVPMGAIAGALALLWRVPTPAPSVKNDGPNVLILGFDALRPDHVGYFGYEREITPNIDRFLEESAVWTQTYTPLARTAPSWMTILTGTFPYTHQIRDPLPDPARLVPPVPTLPQALAQRGYFTAFSTDDSRFSYMVPEHGFAAIEQPPVGLASFAISGTEPRFRAFYGLLDNPLGWLLVPAVRMNQAFGRSYRPDRFDAANLQLLAEASKNERFFLASHDCTLHAPADRFHPYTMLFDQAGYRGRNRFRYMTVGSSAVTDGATEDVEAAAARQNLNLYDAGLVQVDATVGRVRAELEASGLWENTIVVLLSDHGEDFWEEERRYRFLGPNHGFHPWGEGQHHVLLGIHWPASLRERYPHGRHEHLASLADLAPTLAEALGIPWNGDGRSLYDGSPRVLYTETGLSEPTYWKKELEGHARYPFPATSKHYAVDPTTGRVYAKPEHRDGVIRAKDRFVQDERYKLVWYPVEGGGRVDLFDWRADPLNTNDLDQEKPDVVKRLWAELRPRILADGIQAPDAPPRRPRKVALADTLEEN